VFAYVSGLISPAEYTGNHPGYQSSLKTMMHLPKPITLYNDSHCLNKEISDDIAPDYGNTVP
jgi:hypothetical protein